MLSGGLGLPVDVASVWNFRLFSCTSSSNSSFSTVRMVPPRSSQNGEGGGGHTGIMKKLIGGRVAAHLWFLQRSK